VTAPLLATGVRRSLAQIRYVSPVLPGRAEGLVAEVYEQAERDFGFVAAPLVLHSPAPTALAASWLLLRETMLAAGSASRAQKETVAAAVSAANECPYCVAVHSAAVRELAGAAVSAELAAGHFADVPDRGLRDLALWAGETGSPGGGQRAPAGSYPELAGVAICFHYLNRMVSIFLPESPLPPLTPKPVGSWVMAMLASTMVAPTPAPGASLGLLPDAPLPAEFGWAAAAPHVAAALARAAAAADAAGGRVISPLVRELVLDRLRGWDGRATGPSRSWADDAADLLPPADRPLARLALLAAFAPYQISKNDVQASGAVGGEELVVLTSWASMAAARAIGSWL
jgi:AhpD family alkylhydroperoxidase